MLLSSLSSETAPGADEPMFSGNMSSENAPGEDGGGEKKSLSPGRGCSEDKLDIIRFRKVAPGSGSGKWSRKVAPEGIISDG